jgi:2-polyprenyl-3-methyl-5-hydroxy-6-metoxy-1,4-benzoquinol methylase
MDMTSNNNEKQIQEAFIWSRSVFHSTYNQYLAKYKVESCLENICGDSLLDLACGDGLITELFARQVSRVVGVDANGKHLSEARKRLPDAEFYESLIEDLELDERFDTVTMLDLLEHVVDPIIVLRKAASFLADNGVLIIHVPNAHAINRRLAVLMGTLECCEELSPFDLEIAGHRRSYSLRTLREDIERAGLRIIKTGGIFYKILSTPQMDWFLKNGLWEEGGHGWGRVGGPQKDWMAEFCRASYELGKQHPEDCNIIHACITR